MSSRDGLKIKMTPEERHRTWINQAQADAERGVISCRTCGGVAPLDAATTLWRNGMLVFAICDRCAQSHHVLISPTERGVEIRAKARGAIIVRGGQ